MSGQPDPAELDAITADPPTNCSCGRAQTIAFWAEASHGAFWSATCPLLWPYWTRDGIHAGTRPVWHDGTWRHSAGDSNSFELAARQLIAQLQALGIPLRDEPARTSALHAAATAPRIDDLGIAWQWLTTELLTSGTPDFLEHGGAHDATG